MANTKDLIKKEEAFGFHVNPGTIQGYINFVDGVIRKHQQVHVFYHNLHSLYLYFHDPSIQTLYRNATIMVDGMPIVWLLRVAGVTTVRRDQRVTWVDFIWPLLEHANERGWRVFWLGNSSEALEVGLVIIKQRFPELVISGHHGHFDNTRGSVDNKRIIAQINEYGADLCIVGMGSPRQERWVAQHRSLLGVPAILTAGACIEYLAGKVGTPPRWMGRWGLEWCYRVFENPGRFAHRYFIEPWVLLFMIILHRIRKR